ncbi:MAG: DMT family transporter [Geminicoccaceae bacterium]
MIRTGVIRICSMERADSPGIRHHVLSDRNGIAAILMIVLIGVLWGLNWPVVKFMLTEMPPLTIRAAAFPIAALLLALVARLAGHGLRPSRGDLLPIMVTGLFLVFGFNVLTTFGQLVTETSRAAIIAYTMPVLTAVLAVVFLREQLEWRIVAALMIGMAALAVLISEDTAVVASGPTGPAIMMLAALSWALGNVALKSRKWSLSPLALTVWFFVISSLASWPLVLLFEPPWMQAWPSRSVLLALAYHVLGPMVVCYAVWTLALGRLSATTAAISTLTAPIVGVGSAVFFLGEQATWQKFAALAMVVASVLMTLLPRMGQERRP